MDHPYGEQYGQEGNPRAYMTMRDYRNLPYQWGNQQPLGRNPNPNMSLRECRDKWMRAPVYHVPSTYPPPPQYDHPEPPFYASTPQSPQQQPPPPLSPVEQAILNLSKVVGIFAEEQKVLSVQTKQNIEAVESSVNRNLSNVHAEISKLSNQLLQSSVKEKGLFQGQQYQNMVNETGLTKDTTTRTDEVKAVVTLRSGRELQTAVPELVKSAPVVAEPLQEEQSVAKEESQEEECLTETVLVGQVQLQPQEELKEESLETPEELQDAPVNFWPWTKEEQIRALITEESSGHEGTQEPIIDLDTTATAQETKCPLPVPPSDDQVYILPTPETQPKPAAPAPKAKSNPLHVMQNFKELVASVHAFATTSKKMANAYIAWHSGWFGCGFGFGAPGPRHF